MNGIVRKNLLVRISTILATACLLRGTLSVAQVASPASAGAPDSNWKQVEDAMGRPGQMQPGDVIKFGMPRKDLHVVLDGVDIKPGLALGSWAAFKRDGGGAMVMATWFSLRMRSSQYTSSVLNGNQKQFVRDRPILCMAIAPQILRNGSVRFERWLPM